MQGESSGQLRRRIFRRESFWIRELCTLWPYGLNDNLMGYGNVSQRKQEGISFLFNQHKRRPRSHGHKKGSSLSAHDYITLDYLNTKWATNGIHHVKTLLYHIPHSKLHDLDNRLDEAHSKKQIPTQLYYLIGDVIYCRLFSPVKTTGNVEKRFFLKIKYVNRGIDHLHLSNIFHDDDVIQQIPNYFKNTNPPIISYSYSRPIGPSILNFNQTVRNFDPKTFENMKCNCTKSDFNYKPHGHVITGDLSFIKNDSLRSLFKKGPKYREQETIDLAQTSSIIHEALDTYAETWAKKEEVEVSVLTDWLDTCKTIIEKRIIKIKDSVKQPPPKILLDPKVKRDLKHIQRNFVLVPADKAANNIIIICKKFYYSVLVDELKIGTNNPNNTYQLVNDTLLNIVTEHQTFLNSYSISLSTKDQDLPRIYWAPKLHKTPFKFRFIAGSKNCSTKKVSVLLTKGLDLIKNRWISYCQSIFNNSGINYM